MGDGSRTTAGVRMVRAAVEDVAYVSRRMRADEVQQWLALTGLPEYDPDVAARSIIATMGELAFAIVDGDGRAIVVGGFDEIRPQVWQTWMVGSDEGWAQYWRSITKITRGAMGDLLASGRAHRLQTHALASRTAAQEWYRRGLGMTYEGTHRRHFADGSDAVCYARIRED